MLEELRGKKIAIAGLGKNNQNLAQYLKEEGFEFEVIENWKSPEELKEKFDSFDVIFRTPGLPYLSPPVQEAIYQGKKVTSQTNLFFEICPCPIIGVTGTKGKGTTSSLIAKILEAGNKKVWLAGNIGRDPFEFIREIKPEDLVVLELSSFQLQDLEQSPHIAVVLSITPDHLNHHQSFDEYVRAKSKILEHQKETDFAILHPSLPDWFKALGSAQKYYIDPKTVEAYKRKLLGQHNLDNIAAAAAVAKILKIPEDKIMDAVTNFEPLPHRLQIVAEKNGITFVDDSISTNEDSTIAAIQTFEKPVVAILGGSTKGLDYIKLGNTVKNAKNLKAVIVIGEVAPVILRAIEGFGGKIISGAKTMAEVFEQVKTVAAAGDVVLLSPAAASFDMFKDYKDRGEQFLKLVNSL